MTLIRILHLTVALALVLGLASATPVTATTNCTFTIKGKVMKLDADCTTDDVILIPDKFKLDGQGHTITAVDPQGSAFDSAILQNAGAKAGVTDVTLTASGLANVCDVGDAKLRGILFDGASGSITDTHIVDVNKSGQGNCTSQGASILARNLAPGAEPTRVTVKNNEVSGFSKIAISLSGAVKGTVVANTLTGLGGAGVASDNQTGVAITSGATGTISKNTITQTWTSGDPDVVGVSAVESDKLHVKNNVISGAALGVFLQAACVTLPSASKGAITGNEVHTHLEGITLASRSRAESTCNAHVDENHIQKNTIEAPVGVTGGSGIVLLTQVLGGSFMPVADKNVITKNTIAGYSTPIFRSGDTNTTEKKNTF